MDPDGVQAFCKGKQFSRGMSAGHPVKKPSRESVGEYTRPTPGNFHRVQ
jgi:hypothetical protein